MSDYEALREKVEALLRDWAATTPPNKPETAGHVHWIAIYAAELAGYRKLQRCLHDLGRCIREPLGTVGKQRLFQQRIFDWVKETFGAHNAHPHERCRRFLEEALELAQAEGLDAGEARALLEHVYAKPQGESFQELGGVGVTLLAYAESKGWSADDAAAIEFKRVFEVDPAVFRERHDAKARAGVALPSDADNEVK